MSLLGTLRTLDGINRPGRSNKAWSDRVPKERPPRIGTQMSTVEFIVETKGRLKELPVGGDLHLTVREYELVSTYTPTDYYTEQQDVPTGEWSADPVPVRDADNDGVHTHTISGSLEDDGGHYHDLQDHDHDYVEDSVTHQTSGAELIGGSTAFNKTEEVADHNHALTLTLDSGDSTPGAHSHNVRIPPLKVTVPILSVAWQLVGDPYVLVWINGVYKNEYAFDDPNLPIPSATAVSQDINIISL